MKTENEIFEIIRADQLSCWWLRWKTSLYDEWKSYGSFTGEGVPEGATLNQRVETAIKALHNKLDLDKRTDCKYMYEITLSETKNANQASRQQHIFKTYLEESNLHGINVQSQNANIEILAGLMREERDTYKNMLESKAQNEIEHLKRMNELSLAQQELKYQQKLAKQQQENKWAPETVNTAIDRLSGLIGQIISLSNKNNALTGTQVNTPVPQEKEEVLTEKEKALSKFVDLIDENTKNEHDVQIVTQMFMDMIQKAKNKNNEQNKENESIRKNQKSETEAGNSTDDVQ